MTAHDDTVGNPNASTPAKKKGSGCGKVILILGGLMFLLMLVCGGFIGFFAYNFYPKMSTAPADVTATSKQVLDLDIPAGFTPAMSFSIDNFMMKMRMVTYQQSEGNGELMFGDFQIKIGDPKQQQRPDFSGSDTKSKKLHLGETEVKQLTVRGKPVAFRFSDATSDDSDAKYRVVEGDFQTGTVTTFIRYSIEEDQYDEEAVIQMIESIR